MQEIYREFDTYSEQLQSITTTFLVEIWINWMELMSNEFTKSSLNLFQIIIKIQDKGILFAKVAEMFRLLDMFTAQKNTAAPVLYKSLIYVLIENHHDDTTRQFMMMNFVHFFESSETIPVGILLEPLLKQYMASEGITYKYNTFDFEFFVSIVNHSKLKLQDAIPLLDILAKIYLNDHIFCYAASVPFLMIINKFIEDQVLLGYVQRFVVLAFSMLVKLYPPQEEQPLEPPVSKRRRPLPLPSSKSKAKKKLSMEELDTKLK